MKFPVELPRFDPEETQVEMLSISCRHCHKQSPWGFKTTQSDPNRYTGMEAVYEWQSQHTTHTGHRNFYHWGIMRNIGRVVTF